MEKRMAKLTYGPNSGRETVELRRGTTRRQEEIGRRREKGIEKVTGEIMEGVRGSNRIQREINGVDEAIGGREQRDGEF